MELAQRPLATKSKISAENEVPGTVIWVQDSMVNPDVLQFTEGIEEHGKVAPIMQLGKYSFSILGGLPLCQGVHAFPPVLEGLIH